MQVEFREAPYFHISEETNTCVILRHAREIGDKVKPVFCDVRYYQYIDISRYLIRRYDIKIFFEISIYRGNLDIASKQFLYPTF